MDAHATNSASSTGVGRRRTIAWWKHSFDWAMQLYLVAYVQVEEVVGVLTSFGSGVAQVFHVLLEELWLLLVAEVEEGGRQEEGWEVESEVGRVKQKQPAHTWMKRR